MWNTNVIVRLWILGLAIGVCLVPGHIHYLGHNFGIVLKVKKIFRFKKCPNVRKNVFFLHLFIYLYFFNLVSPQNCYITLTSVLLVLRVNWGQAPACLPVGTSTWMFTSGDKHLSLPVGSLGLTMLKLSKLEVFYYKTHIVQNISQLRCFSLLMNKNFHRCFTSSGVCPLWRFWSYVKIKKSVLIVNWDNFFNYGLSTN